MIATPIVIKACGMVTPVGLGWDPSCAAIRAAIDNFQETPFYTKNAEWIVGAQVPTDESAYRSSRLSDLLARALREILDRLGEVDTTTIPVLLAVAETDRPGRLEELGNLLRDACTLLGVRFHHRSGVIAAGRIGGAVALFHARRMIDGQRIRQAIVAGVDTYLVAASLRHYDDTDRLLTPSTMDGFIPGEAAAAVLVTADDGGEGLIGRGLGFATEPAPFDSGEPLRADGLVAAIRQAMAEAGVGWEGIDYRLIDISGEQYRFKEATLAVARDMRTRKEVFDFWHPADCIGEVGSAALPVMLGVSLHAARKGWAPGPGVLVHLSNDDGRRAAAVLTYRTESN